MLKWSYLNCTDSFVAHQGNHILHQYQRHFGLPLVYCTHLGNCMAQDKCDSKDPNKIRVPPFLSPEDAVSLSTLALGEWTRVQSMRLPAQQINETVNFLMYTCTSHETSAASLTVFPFQVLCQLFQCNIPFQNFHELVKFCCTIDVWRCKSGLHNMK